jgi:hypothetical protein
MWVIFLFQDDHESFEGRIYLNKTQYKVQVKYFNITSEPQLIRRYVP